VPAYKVPPYTHTQHHSAQAARANHHGHERTLALDRAGDRFSGYASGSGSEDYGPSERDRWAMGHREAPRVREESC
jgi:hypothetical protein